MTPSTAAPTSPSVGSENEVHSQAPSQVRPYPYPVSFLEILPSEDNENMDSPWHRSQMELLINVIETNWKGKRFFCGGNMFVHFSAEHVRNRDFRGPDFFVVLDVDHDKPRDYWAIWEEGGRYPNLIIELLSLTTADEDLNVKKDVYERTFGTHEYFCYDPDGEKLLGWRLNGEYQPIPLESGRMWSKQLEMWLGTWKGTWDGHEMTWLRFFKWNGILLPTQGETEAARANAEAARANEAEAEIKRLREELEALRSQQNTPNH